MELLLRNLRRGHPHSTPHMWGRSLREVFPVPRGNPRSSDGLGKLHTSRTLSRWERCNALVSIENVKCFFLYLTVDGSWTAWGPWGQCSVTCGSGTRKKSRECLKPRHGGEARCTVPTDDHRYNCTKQEQNMLHTSVGSYRQTK